MSSRNPNRFALYWLLAVALVLPRIAASAQAISALAVVASASAMTHDAGAKMPCGEMPAPADHHVVPDGCSTHDCDLSTCIGAACLPELPRMLAQSISHAVPAPWRQPMHHPRLIDPPLRPPIA
jgi:hypothetical protein